MSEAREHKKYRRKIDEHYQNALKRLSELEQQKAELLEFIRHLYVNYHLPYGAMDIKTKKRFEEIRNKYK